MHFISLFGKETYQLERYAHPMTDKVRCTNVFIMMTSLLSLIFILMLTLTARASYNESYYVSANGNDMNDGLSELTPFETLAQTAAVINGAGTGGNYLIFVMTDLSITDCARYYDNKVTITSLGYAPVTVTRGLGFSCISDSARGWYNPAMLEIETASLTPASLTLENIILDDAYLHEGTIFGYAPTDGGISGTGTNYVQDGIITSYAPNATIILNGGSELRNFGGMTAIRAAGANVAMHSGSSITDINANMDITRAGSAGIYYANGEAAVSIINSGVAMYDGSRITNIANAHGIKLSGAVKLFMDGEISNLIGVRGMDADPGGAGRAFKSAILFNGCTTLSLNGDSGPAVIGPHGLIVNNQTKCGAIGINRAPDTSLELYGKINRNTGMPGGTGALEGLQGTNGAGLYIVGGGTAYLKEGSELCYNQVLGETGYGGAASIQQAGSKLIMDGGLVSGNTAPSGGSAAPTEGAPGIAMNKGNASFTMNGGIIDNGPYGLHLFSNSGDGTDCTLTLNNGSVSGVVVNSTTQWGNTTQRQLYLNEDCVTIETGYISVAGRQVTPISAGFYIGNPNTANYTNIKNALPEGWTMPSSAANVIGFWMKKAGTAVFSVPTPVTGLGGADYDVSLNVYFAAVQETTATGTASASSVKFYPTRIVNGQIVLTLPLSVYTNGATAALVQPTTDYGTIELTGPAELSYNSAASAAAPYVIPYTSLYDMPSGLRELLLADRQDNSNTSITLYIRPDAKTAPDTSSLAIDSDIFELDGIPVWDAVSGEWAVPLMLKDGWDIAMNLSTAFSFSCSMDPPHFTSGDSLFLTGALELAGDNGKIYYAYGGWVTTVTVVNPPTTYTVTVNDSYTEISGTGAYTPGDTVIISAGIRNGYSFNGWTTLSGVAFANVNSATTSFTMPSSDVIVSANWSNNGGSGGGQSPSPTPSPGQSSPVPTPGPSTPTTAILAPTGTADTPATSTPTATAIPMTTDTPISTTNVPEPTLAYTPPMLISTPTPIAPPDVPGGHQLVFNGPGSYLEMDKSGTPLGEWNCDSGIWDFTEFPSLARPEVIVNPKTGDTNASFLLLVFGASLLGLGGIANITLKRRKNRIRR